MIRSTIPADIDITQDIQDDCGMVMGAPTQIHQICMNLITNAYHAVEPIRGKIHIQLQEISLNKGDLIDSFLEPGRYAVLSVADTGCGIDRSIIDKIFEPYFTTKEQGKGTGIGLSVVYGIVKEYGGDIKVYSELGKGTTINVYIPVKKKIFEIEEIEFEEKLELGNERILVVDDEEAVARIEKQMLERLGYQVTTRTSSLEALEAFRVNPDAYDLVISDMTMPNLTGDQLAGEIFSIRANIPIIICTGFSERINREKAEAIGIKGFLMKPVVISKMAKMVRRVLGEMEDING